MRLEKLNMPQLSTHNCNETTCVCGRRCASGLTWARIDSKRAASGLKWEPCGKTPPRDGQQLRNTKLEEMLKTRLEFTQEEWDAFGVDNLCCGHFVQSKSSYFQPAGPARMQGLQNADLADALKRKMKFSKQEWIDLGLAERLQPGAIDLFAKSGTCFFHPTGCGGPCPNPQPRACGCSIPILCKKLMSLDVTKMMMIKEMYLDNNDIRRLPEDFGNLFNIYELKLMNNQLECLPDSIGKLTNLQLLFLRNNKIRELPGSIGNCKAIQVFQLSLNPIEELPPQLGLLTNIRDLNLDNTPALRLPPEGVRAQGLKQMQRFLRMLYEAQASLQLNLSELKLDEMPSIAAFQGLTSLEMLSNNISFLGPSVVRSYDLQTVRLSDNQFEQFPTEVLCFKSLVFLDLSFNKLESLPADFRAITRLKEFHLSHNFLREIPPAIQQLQSMTKFIGDDNFFTTVPDEIEYCASLTELVLGSNQIRELPVVVCMLSQLTILELANNLLGELPESIGEMENLRTLNISNNLLKRLRRELGRLFPTINSDKKDQEKYWKQSISYEQNPIRTPPKEILRHGPRAALEYLKSINEAEENRVLDLSSQQLSSFPLEIWQLKELLQLSIESNNISVIPPDIVCCNRLEILNVADNQIAMLPYQLGELVDLKQFVLSKNFVSALPPDLMQCTKLTELDVSSNRLSALDEDVCTALFNLVVLNVEQNQISVLPDVVQKLTCVESLLLGSNRISILPPTMFCMTSLIELGLSGNPLKSPPAEVMKLSSGRSELDADDIYIGSKVIALFQSITEKNETWLGCIIRHKQSNGDYIIEWDGAARNYLRQIDGDTSNTTKNIAELGKRKLPALDYLKQIHLAKGENGVLELTGFLLTSVPPAIKTLVNVSYIKMDMNRLRDFPPSLRVLTKLEKLELNENSFQSLPEEIATFPNLTSVSLSYNEFLVWPEPISACTRLTELDFAHNAIKEIPKSVRTLTLLVALCMTGNEIEKVSEGIGECLNLKKLYLGENVITRLPDSLGNLTRLTTLDLSSNSLSTLPLQVAMLTNLEDLQIQENKFSVTEEAVPGLGLMAMIKYFQSCAMAQFTKKIALNVMGMSEIPPDILQYSQLTNISIMGNKLTQLPEIFGQNLQHLKRINVRSNQLSSLPGSFSKIQRCEFLDLSHNAFKTFPGPACELKAVSFLDFSFNSLKKVDEAIGNMVGLEHLRLDNNKLKELPSSFGRLPTLSRLNARHNELTDLKGALAGCTALTDLDLRNNKLPKVPPEMGGLTNLIRLALSHNSLNSLPSEMGELRKLRDFGIVGNHIKVPNKQVLEAGMDFVLEYLYSMGQAEEVGGESNGQLILDGMAFTEFPQEVLTLKTLTLLSICSNQIVDIPPQINHLVALQKFYASDNRIKRLPDQFTSMYELRLVEAEKNELKNVPEGMGILEEIETLVFNQNLFEIVPLELGKIKKLRVLAMEGNPLKYPFNVLFARGFDKVIDFLVSVADGHKTKTINLGGIQFTKVPEALKEETYAESIILHGNDLMSVPSFCHNPAFTELRSLSLAENNLTDLPREIYKITSLTRLDLQFNRLRNLPDYIGDLTRLTDLNISNNVIVSLPFIISSKLTRLEFFRADSNRIRSVPTLGNMTALLVLSVMDNQLSSLDSSQANLAGALREVWVSGNELTLLPPWLCDRSTIEYIDVSLRDMDPTQGADSTTLKLKLKDVMRAWVPGLRMDLSNLGLETIPSDIWKKNAIGNLNCSGNKISELPKEIGILVNLTHIYLVHNQLDDLPETFGTLQSLKVCRLDHNFFDEIPKCIYKLRNLEKLTLSFNSITHYIEQGIGQLIDLKVFWINNNQLEGFHEEMGKLRGLTEIIASDNLISDLPKGFRYLTNLRTLRIERNQLRTICLPFGLGNLISLADVRIHGNPVPEDEALILAKGPLYTKRFCSALYCSEDSSNLNLDVLLLSCLPQNICNFDFVLHLNCADNKITELPPQIARLVNLSSLDCSRNLLSALPPEMSQMQLVSLVMSKNRLFSIPAVVHEIGIFHRRTHHDGEESSGVPTLRVLDVSGNRLINLASALGHMHELVELRIDSNKIRHLSNVIEGLWNLQVLDARNNAIPTLPIEIGKCSALEQLYLDNNEIQTIPGSLGNLTNLTRLGLSHNKITSFPLSLSNLTILQRLDYEHNNISVPCQYIRDKGYSIMLKYMHAIVQSIQTKRLTLASFSMVEVPPEIMQYKGASALTTLSLYENKFKIIPDEISMHMENLRTIDATRNLLTDLPESMTQLMHLRTLLLNENKFEVWPSVLWALTNLETLSVEDNFLTGIPGEIMRLKRLHDSNNFKFAGNDIKFPPPEIQMQDMPVMYKFLAALGDAGTKKAAELKSFGLINFPEFWNYHESPWYTWIPKVNLKDNSIQSIPKEIESMEAITELLLDDNRIETIAAEVCRLPHLTNLQLSNNCISTLPENLLDFSNKPVGLKHFGLGKNRFPSFPIRLCEIDSLESLILDENNFSDLPAEMARLDRLQMLSLANNRLTTLPNELQALKNLVELRINRNKMKEIPACITAMLGQIAELKMAENEFETITEEMSTKSTSTMLRYRDMLDRARRENVMNLSQMAIRAVPSEIKDLQNLQDLNISNNQITALPDFVGLFAKLKFLDMAFNRITELPLSIASLIRLEMLMMDHNQLSEIPDSCSGCTALRHLSASYNQILDISDGLSSLESLTLIDLQHNELVSLPVNLSTLVNLQECFLNNNKIMELPGSTIECMTNMVKLHLHENRLQYLPWELGEMQILKDFTYEANELDTPTPEILSVGAKDLMNYMKKVNKSKKTKILKLTRMRLSLYPTELKTVTMITDLNLSNNKLLEIDSVVARMRDLTALDFSHNTLITLPASLGKCHKIISLDMSMNRISHLPDSLEGLKDMRVLKMNDNRMVRMPTFLKAMMKLQQLWLHENQFVNVSADIKLGGDAFVLEPNKEQYKALVEGVSKQQELVSKLLDAVSPDLTTLTLGNNKLSEWGRWFPQASSLTRLDLDANKIRQMPSACTALTNLKILSSRNNRIKSLPLHMSAFSALETLHLDRNQIEDVPPTTRHLTKMKQLTLAHNRIKGKWCFFPISSLSNLTELRLTGNELPEPPPGVARLPFLRFFDWRPVSQEVDLAVVD